MAYRIADARHPIFDPAGAMLHGGRWNSIGHRVIYASETYAGALLEVLVHSNLSQPPKNHRVIRIDIPDEVKIEAVAIDLIESWDAEDMTASRAFGDAWIRANRTAVLRVPSVITQGRETNLVLNTAHPQFALITAGAPEPWNGTGDCSARPRRFRIITRPRVPSVPCLNEETAI